MKRLKYALILYPRAVPVALLGLLVWPVLVAVWALIFVAIAVVAAVWAVGLVIGTVGWVVSKAALWVAGIIEAIADGLTRRGASLGAYGFTWQALLTLNAPFKSVTCAAPDLYAAAEFARLCHLVARTRATEIRWRRSCIALYTAIRTVNPPEKIHYELNQGIAHHLAALGAMGVEP